MQINDKFRYENKIFTLQNIIQDWHMFTTSIDTKVIHNITSSLEWALNNMTPIETNKYAIGDAVKVKILNQTFIGVITRTPTSKIRAYFCKGVCIENTEVTHNEWTVFENDIQLLVNAHSESNIDNDNS
jgi:hypothetical protein